MTGAAADVPFAASMSEFGGRQPVRYRAAIIVKQPFVQVAGQGGDGALLVENGPAALESPDVLNGLSFRLGRSDAS